MDDEPVQMKLKKKYLVASGRPKRNGAYRSRTGPKCCNDGCGRKHRKITQLPARRG